MEPIDKWEAGFKEYFASADPATGEYIINFDYGSLYPSVLKIYKHPSEPEEKTQTLNESRLKEIKP